MASLIINQICCLFLWEGCKKERGKSANHFNEKLHIIADVEINVLVLTNVAYNANILEQLVQFIAILQACHRGHLFSKWFENTLPTHSMKIMNGLA